jgi:glycosyltransferase involved in cell wall biosynthesis
MKNIVFISDLKYSVKEDNLFSERDLNNLIQRYSYISNNISITMRKINYKEGYKKIEGVSKYYQLKELSSIFSLFFHILPVIRTIKDMIIHNDFFILRTPSIYCFISIYYIAKYNKPYLVEVVGCPWDTLWNHSLFGKCIAPFFYLLEKWAVKNAPFVHYVSNKFLQKRYPTHGVTLACSDVAIKDISNTILEKRLKKIKKYVKNCTLILGTVGAVHVKYKGHDLVFQAMARLRNDGINFEYHIAGGGSQERLRRLAKKYKVSDNVVFLGVLPHGNIFTFLDTIDIYVQPSFTEGLPRAVIEAMSRGCPVLGSSAGGIPELLSAENIFKKGNIMSLTHKLKNIVSSDMTVTAIQNFEKSKEFQSNISSKNVNTFYNKLTKTYFNV